MPTLVRYPDKPNNLLGMVPAGRITKVIGEQTEEEKKKNQEKPSPAYEAGLRKDDLVLAVGNSNHINSVLGLQMTILGNPDEGLPFTVLRDGKVITTDPIKPNKDNMVGLQIVPALDTLVVAKALEGLPATDALNEGDPFLPGTRITHLGGQPVKDWADLQRKLQNIADSTEGVNPDNPPTIALTLEVPAGGNTITEEVQIAISPDAKVALVLPRAGPQTTRPSSR